MLPPTGRTWPTAARLGDVPEIDGVSAGGMPDRVKCLHALVGHALAAGPGVNPLGDEAVADDRRVLAYAVSARTPDERGPSPPSTAAPTRSGS